MQTISTSYCANAGGDVIIPSSPSSGNIKLLNETVNAITSGVIVSIY